MNIDVSGIEAQVCQLIADRQAKGIAKYGTTVHENPLVMREWLQHALEETLDLAIYRRSEGLKVPLDCPVKLNY